MEIIVCDFLQEQTNFKYFVTRQNSLNIHIYSFLFCRIKYTYIFIFLLFNLNILVINGNKMYLKSLNETYKFTIKSKISQES